MYNFDITKLNILTAKFKHCILKVCKFFKKDEKVFNFQFSLGYRALSVSADLHKSLSVAHCFYIAGAYQCSGGVTTTTKPKVLSYWLIVQKPLSDWLDLLWWNHWHTLLILLSSFKYETVCVGCQNWRQQRKNVKKFCQNASSNEFIWYRKQFYNYFQNIQHMNAKVWFLCKVFMTLFYVYIFSKFVLAKQLVQGHQVWFSRLWIFILGCTGSPHFTWFHFTWLLEK